MQRMRPSLAKLTRPRLHSPIARDRLFATLDMAHACYSAVGVVGPPGAGKTTLVGSWLDARHLPGIWYQVDRGDTEPATFFHYLVQAARPFLEETQLRLPLLTAEYAQDVPGFARRFFRDLFSLLPAPSVLVLDNFQEIEDADSFHTVLVEAIEQIPEHATLVIVSRARPPAHYARFLANELLLLVEWDALRLTLDETRAMASARGSLEERALEAIHHHSDGWAAGVTLMMERLRRSGDVKTLGAAVSLETIFDYFASQLLNQVPVKVRDVLMKCALFQSMSAGLAAAITDDADAGDILEDMYRRHLFVDRRFESEVLYQFHALFRAFLLHRLELSVGAEARVALTRRAANLIASEGRTDEAMTLFIQAGDWAAATQLLLREAPAMLGQGRNRTLREWLEAMPESWFGEHPWLAYWLGQSWLPEDLRAARAAFERSYAGQKSVSDIGGQILAIAGIMETHYFLWSQFSALDPWIAEICDLLDKSPAFANFEMELRVYGVLLMATHHRAPRSPWLFRAVERIRALLSANLSDDWKVRAGNMLLGFAHAASNLSLGRWVVEAIGPIVEGGKVTPLARCMWLGRIGLHLAHRGRYEEAIAAVDQADALARDQGIGADAALRAFWGVMATMNGGDLPRAEAFVSRLEAIARRDRPAEIAMAHYCRCMLALATGDRMAALDNGRSAVCIASAEGAFWLHVNAISVTIYALIDAGELGDAARHARELRSLVQDTFLAAFEAEVELCEAALALASQDRATAHRHLRRACQIARSRGYLFFNRAMPRPLRSVLSEALRAEVEFEYFREIIRRFGLWPGPDGDDNWPWPLRLRVLGSFELLVDGAPPIFSRKLPRKTLALLCLIIALGGRDVAEQHVIDALWPEEEGDVAYRSLAASVRRLRELLGRKGAIRHSGGRLSLDARGLWLDAWALEKALETDHDPALAIRLYRGAFLPGEDAPWATPMRERLRMKFLRAVNAVGSQQEQSDRFEDAADTYERALNADNTAEPLYQGLMRCYGRLQRPAEVARVYYRLSQALAISARTPPSPASEQLYRRFSLPESVNTRSL